MRYHDYLHLTDGETEARGHSQETAGANLGSMINWSWVASRVTFGFMGARSGNFPGLFLPAFPLPPAPSTEPHTVVTRETLVPFIPRTISNMGQVYFWGTLFACPKERPLANGYRPNTLTGSLCLQPPLTHVPESPWTGSSHRPTGQGTHHPLAYLPGSQAGQCLFLPRCPHTRILGSDLASPSPNLPRARVWAQVLGTQLARSKSMGKALLQNYPKGMSEAQRTKQGAACRSSAPCLTLSSQTTSQLKD